MVRCRAPMEMHLLFCGVRGLHRAGTLPRGERSRARCRHLNRFFPTHEEERRVSSHARLHTPLRFLTVLPRPQARTRSRGPAAPSAHARPGHGCRAMVATKAPFTAILHFSAHLPATHGSPVRSVSSEKSRPRAGPVTRQQLAAGRVGADMRTGGFWRGSLSQRRLNEGQTCAGERHLGLAVSSALTRSCDRTV